MDRPQLLVFCRNERGGGGGGGEGSSGMIIEYYTHMVPHCTQFYVQPLHEYVGYVSTFGGFWWLLARAGESGTSGAERDADVTPSGFVGGCPMSYAGAEAAASYSAGKRSMPPGKTCLIFRLNLTVEANLEHK